MPKVSRQWPKPTVPEPDLERLMHWLFTDVCEATDGCEVKPDGICPHGHPSWVLRKEMV
jgi:hypothetical protein